MGVGCDLACKPSLSPACGSVPGRTNHRWLFSDQQSVWLFRENSKSQWISPWESLVQTVLQLLQDRTYAWWLKIKFMSWGIKSRSVFIHKMLRHSPLLLLLSSLKQSWEVILNCLSPHTLSCYVTIWWGQFCSMGYCLTLHSSCATVESTPWNTAGIVHHQDNRSVFPAWHSPPPTLSGLSKRNFLTSPALILPIQYCCSLLRDYAP